MTAHKVTLVNRDQTTVTVDESEILLDALEAADIKLPFGCRFGACVTCAARLRIGKVDQSAGVALKPAQQAMGYVLLCIAHPLSDCVFEVGVECQDDLYVNPFRGTR